MNRPKELQAGWTVFCVMSTLLLSASLIECTSNTNVSIVVTTPSDAVNTSSTVLMVCVAHGSPPPSIGWQYRDTTVTNCTSQRHTVYERQVETELNTTFTESILEICSTEPEDSGEYLCTANNGFSSASATNPTNLTVIPETPSVGVVVTTPSDTVNSGSTVLLVCVAYGTPESPSINWLFNGATILSNSTSCQHTIYERRMKSNHSNLYFTESILEVCDVGLTNSGEYLCTASLGEATANATNATVLTVLSEAPPPPVNCSSVPVLNEEGTLLSVNFSWAQVNVPEEVITRTTNDLNITGYTLSLVGSGTHRVSAQAVCPNKAVGTCSYSFPVQYSNLSSGADYNGQVAAENVAGSGRICSLLRPQTSVQFSSAFLTLSDSTTDANTRKMVECLQPGSVGVGQSFRCEFCYSLNRSCQSSMTCMDVIPGSGSATLLPSSLAEGTYCYRATAIVDGSPTRAIQDVFSIRSPCASTAAEPLTSPGSSMPSAGSSLSDTFSLPVTASISAIIALILGLLIGCMFGGCFVYMCVSRRKPMLAQMDNITQNVGAVDASTKYLTINSAYESSKDTAMGQDAVDFNRATQAQGQEAPQYEDMEEVCKAYHDTRNDFELSENDAYSRTDNVAESFYDNDADVIIKND